MPDPNQLSPGANGGRVNLQAAPGGEFNFDDLFPNPEATPAVVPQTPQGTPPPQSAQPSEAQPFLKAGSSVYLTAEEAARGVEHKDALVSRYRAFLEEKGFDPNTLTEVQKPQTSDSTSPYKYLGHEDKLFDDLSDAVTRKDKAAYGRIQFAAMQEALDVRLAPYQGYMAESARQRAIREVSKEIPDFAAFYGSDNYKAVSDRIPLIRDMEQVGESNPEAAKRLPELYKMSYLIHQGLNRQPSIPAPGAPAPNQVQSNPSSPRPTTQPSSLTPPAPGVDTRSWTQSTGTGRNLNSDARKQLIRDFEARGIQDRDWSASGT